MLPGCSEQSSLGSPVQAVSAVSQEETAARELEEPSSLAGTLWVP